MLRHHVGVSKPSWFRWFSPWWVKLALVIALLSALSLAVSGSDFFSDDEPSDYVKAHYAEWRAECEDYATSRLYGTPYDVGGQRWADLVNDCMVDKAADSP